MKDKNQIIEIIRDYLITFNEISFAYLFGSFVKSDRYEDIDIAVFLNKDFDYKNLNKFPYGYHSFLIGNLCLKLKTDNVDLVLLNESDLFLFKKIITTGKLLFEKDKFFRIKLESSIKKEFIDTDHYRKIKLKSLQDKLNVR